VNGLTWIAAFHLIFCLALLIRFEYGTQPYLFTRWNFKQRYGPWALVAGASEGLGQAYSEQVAAKGLNVVLVARNLESLKNTAKLIEERYRVQTKVKKKKKKKYVKKKNNILFKSFKIPFFFDFDHYLNSLDPSKRSV